ncbi:MAG: hypothetical protein AAGI48_05795 [Verrucomicrobiota bacterium]
MSQPDNSTKASLGCGSLILIAIIVLIFSRSGDTEKLEQELRDARSEIKELKAEVAEQSATLSRIENALKDARPNEQ